MTCKVWIKRLTYAIENVKNPNALRQGGLDLDESAEMVEGGIGE